MRGRGEDLRWLAVVAAAALVMGCGGSGVEGDEGGGDTRDTRDGEAGDGETGEGGAEISDGEGGETGPEDGDSAEDATAETGEEIVEDTGDDAPDVTAPGTFIADEADLPDEYVFKSVWAGETGRVVAVGNDGIVATQRPDGAWGIITQAHGIGLLNSVHGSDGQNLFAVGIDGGMLQGTVSGFAPVASGVSDTLWAVHVVASDRAFAVGRGGVIIAWNGERWAESTSADPGAVWNAVAGYDGVVALVGNGGTAVLAQSGGIEPIFTGVSANLHGVHTIDGKEFWAVGDQGTLLHGFGSSWSASDRGLVVSVRDVHGQRPDDVYAVGYAGAVVHWGSASWELLESPTTTSLLGVWVDADGGATIVGQDGAVFEGDRVRGFAQTATLFPGGELVDLWGSDDGELLVAVGAQGRIFGREDGRWAEMTSPTSQGLEAVWGTSADDVWAVGRSGIALHFDGTEWTRIETPVTQLIAAVWGDAEDSYLAAGSGGTLLSWNGTSWQSVASATTNNLRAVTSRDGLVFTAGALGTILRYNGLGWGLMPVQGIPNADGGEDPITDELLAIWMAAPDDGWAVGENGRMLHWDGKLWGIVETEWTTALRGIYGLAGDDIWAVGTAGHILHWDGQEWSKLETNTIATLYAIHGDGDRHVVVVGDLGTVLRLDR